MSEELRLAARAIFHDALQSVDVRDAVRRRIALREGVLTLANQPVSLTKLDRVLVLAVGKAAVPMFEAARDALPGTPVEAVVIAPQETLPPDAPAWFLPGSHPTPTADSTRAAEAALNLLRSATERDAVLFLVSGGASAMMEEPLDRSISESDVAAFHRALVSSGLPIREMNALRKHVSAVKGGRLAQAAQHTRVQCSLLVSDVPHGAADVIGSGPSLPDSSTVADCAPVLARLQASATLPESIVHFFHNALPETPKPDDPAFARAHWEVILSSEHLQQAASEAARVHGFTPMVDNTCDEWEYRDAGRYLLDRAAAADPKTCLISVGEVNVSISAEHGRGGRNQQFALWCAAEIARRGLQMTVLSAGSDGVDGHSDAAGAVCDETTPARATAADESISEALTRFDTAKLLQKTSDALVTGPTGNNLRDLRLILKP